MRRTRTRIEAVEQDLARSHPADPYVETRSMALGRLSDEELDIVAEILEQGKQEEEWTETESAAIAALTRAFDEESRLLPPPPKTTAGRRHQLEMTTRLGEA
jgi:hypothetical protein